MDICHCCRHRHPHCHTMKIVVVIIMIRIELPSRTLPETYDTPETQWFEG